ncbi:josephin-like protein [Lepeophtheirus salmonis]|uniref:ubiquitinyl hydrolase 1 n=1 Tax=Lepeophtheirus salmonis TaxID=72036 RepID=A0A0K2V7E7_LEPSM|nr:josephin-like protein [Lepeophtheirus salmonis]
MYHERQSRQLCALHVLNNLFQNGKAFDQKDLDIICSRLSPESWLNPHRSFFGLGNYDVNVLMAAFQDKGLESVWFDKRRDIASLNLDSIFGFILNVPNNYRYLPLFSQRHWIALRFFEDEKMYFNLDSHLKKPELIGREEDMIKYLTDKLFKSDNELILIMKSSYSREEMWRS